MFSVRSKNIPAQPRVIPNYKFQIANEFQMTNDKNHILFNLTLVIYLSFVIGNLSLASSVILEYAPAKPSFRGFFFKNLLKDVMNDNIINIRWCTMSDSKCGIRVWQEFDLDDVKEHLLIAGDPTGDCAGCREVGIRIQDAKTCPNCRTEFKYIATRLQNNPSQARKLKNKRPDLIAIDLSDYKAAMSRREAHRFMKD